MNDKNISESTGKPGDDDAESALSGEIDRRRFIRYIGKVIFTATLVDINPGINPGAEVRACAPPPCGGGTPDSSCDSAGDIDANCGYPAPRPGSDADQGCSASQTDNNCYNDGSSSGQSQDEDQHCTSGGSDPDNSCGDCDDNHDTDDHCSSGSNADNDDLCGHQHVVGIDKDDNCSTTVKDEGCGVHQTSYGGTDTDTDEYCAGGNPPGSNPDQNCTSSSADANCNGSTNPSTTLPDEHCGASDPDQACSHYDMDQSCGVGGTADEACGAFDFAFDDPDNNCDTTPPITDPDNSNDTET